MIAPQKKDKMITSGNLSKTNEKAKKEEMVARMAVKKTVSPIQTYLVVSKRGHFSRSSRLAPEQNIKKLLKALILCLLEFN